jgi:acyl carrier protein
MSHIDNIEFLKSAIKELKNLEVPDLDRSMRLADLKIDSLDAVELQMYYEEKTGVETKDPVKPVVTIGDLIDLMP